MWMERGQEISSLVSDNTCYVTKQIFHNGNCFYRHHVDSAVDFDVEMEKMRTCSNSLS